MKRILFLLLALPMLVVMVSCDHTDDVNVTFSMDFGPDVTVVNGKAYVVSTGTFKIKGIGVRPVNTKHSAAITQVAYWINGLPVYPITNVAPFGMSIAAENLAEGINTVTMDMTVIETDCPISTAVAQIDVVVVPTAEDIPSEGVEPSTNHALPFHMK